MVTLARHSSGERGVDEADADILELLESEWPLEHEGPKVGHIYLLEAPPNSEAAGCLALLVEADGDSATVVPVLLPPYPDLQPNPFDVVVKDGLSGFFGSLPGTRRAIVRPRICAQVPLSRLRCLVGSLDEREISRLSRKPDVVGYADEVTRELTRAWRAQVLELT